MSAADGTVPDELRGRRAAVVEAVGVVAGLVRSPEVGAAWAAASVLDGYTVGGLCGLTYQAVRRTVRFLDHPAAPGTPVVAPGEYYARSASFEPGARESDLHVALRAGGEELAASGPVAVGERLDVLRTTLAARLAGAPPSTLVPVVTMPGSASLLDPYLDTRCVELVVHADDIASSVGLAPPALPVLAYERATAVLLDLAVRRAGPAEVVRAFARPDRARPDALRSI
jgi:hypothetical protein